jgi:hypothetical protein
MKLLACATAVALMASTGTALAAPADLSGTWYPINGGALVITSGTSSSIKGKYYDTPNIGYGPVRTLLGKLSGTITNGRGRIIVTNTNVCPPPDPTSNVVCSNTQTFGVTGFAAANDVTATGYSKGERMSGFTWDSRYPEPSPFTLAGCEAERQGLFAPCHGWSAFRANSATSKRAKALAACKKLKASKRPKCVAAAKKRYPS